MSLNRKLRCVTIGLVSLGFPLAADAQETKPEYSLDMQTVFGEGHIVSDTVQAFAQRANEMSDGRIDVTVRYGSPFGDFYETARQLAQGSTEIGTFVASSELDKRFTITLMGGLVTDWDQARKIYGPDGPFLKLVNEIGEDVGVKYIAWVPTGFGGIPFQGDDAPSTLPSPKSYKVRIPPFRSMEARFEALGFNTVTMPFSETYTAMQTGVIDGKGATPPEEAYQSFADVTGVYLYSKDYFEVVIGIGVNVDWLNGLPEEDRQIIETAGLEAARGAWAVAEDVEEESLQKFEKNGSIELRRLSADEHKKVQSIIRDAEWPVIEEGIGSEMMSRIKSMAQ